MPSRIFPVDLYTSASATVHPVTGSAGPTLFLAAGGTGSSLHVDTLKTHFWMMLCHGAKRWRLVDRDDVSLLHPMYLTDLNPVFPADLNAVESLDSELAPYTAFEGAIYEVLLQPGDLIFVPAGWPHQVDNVETSVAVSANFVDATNLVQCLEEAEILGIVEEDPRLLAQAMKDSQQRLLQQPKASEDEQLRAFKARHGEHRAPWEVQRLLKRGLVTTFLVALSLCAWWCAPSRSKCEEKSALFGCLPLLTHALPAVDIRDRLC